MCTNCSVRFPFLIREGVEMERTFGHSQSSFGIVELGRMWWLIFLCTGGAYYVTYAYRLVPISQGPKNSGIPVPSPLPLPHVMYSICTHPKQYARGCINHRCINSYCKPPHGLLPPALSEIFKINFKLWSANPHRTLYISLTLSFSLRKVG